MRPLSDEHEWCPEHGMSKVVVLGAVHQRYHRAAKGLKSCNLTQRRCGLLEAEYGS